MKTLYKNDKIHTDAKGLQFVASVSLLFPHPSMSARKFPLPIALSFSTILTLTPPSNPHHQRHN